MKLFTNIVLALVVLAALLLPSKAAYIDNNDAENQSFLREAADSLSLQYEVKFRGTRNTCVEHGDSCDHRPGSCCDSWKCRCNLWGANCRCAA